MNKTELMAFQWLKKQGYKEHEIVFNTNRSPDFICLDGKRYEVKYLYGQKLLFSDLQVEKLQEEDIILVFSREAMVTQFLWKNRHKSPFTLKIVDHSGVRTVSFNNEVLGKIEDWRRRQLEIPNFSEAVNILIKKGLVEGGGKHE